MEGGAIWIRVISYEVSTNINIISLVTVKSQENEKRMGVCQTFFFLAEVYRRSNNN
jgi:hypothetical protein